jgi:hypothetical protein
MKTKAIKKTVRPRKATKSRKAANPAFPRLSVAEAKTQLPALLRAGGRTLIYRHGTPAGVVIGFADENDFADWIFDNSPAFRKELEASINEGLKEQRAGKLIPLEEVKRRLGL